MTLCDKDVQFLRGKANAVRRQVIEMAYRAGSGHCGGSLSSADILVTLYYQVLRVRPEEPQWEDRDRFILSKGHAAPALYAALAQRGFFSAETLKTLRKFGSILQGHPDMCKVPGVEISTGSLGMGISNGVGMALAARVKRKHWRVCVLVGDGELDEGQNWEALMLAAKLRLANLVVIVDANGVQLDGTTDEIMPLGDLEAKFRSFGWRVSSCDGHECSALSESLEKSFAAEVPAVVIARTVKGKGVSFMEGNHVWHGAPLKDDLYSRALEELQGALP